MLLKIRWIVISGINAMFFQALIALIFIIIQCPGFEAVCLQKFCGGKTLLRLFSFPDPTRVGASGTGSAQWQLTDLVNVKREKWIASNFLSSVGVVVISFATVGSWLLPWG
jgi:hypothetical protein